MSGAKLWGGRFDGKTDPLAETFNASIQVDQLFLSEDIQGSVAHSRMLAHIGVLTAEEQKQIEEGLKTVEAMFINDPGLFSEAQEDIHMNVEYQLTQCIGEVAKKLHTARSRNDQVALDFRMYVMKQNKLLETLIGNLIEVLLEKAEQHTKDLMPGYTHLQRAQPVTLGFHLLTYIQMFSRDQERLQEQYKRISQMPLGAGALAGLPYPSEREMVKETLGFQSLALHGMDAVSDRDFAVEFLSTGALIQMHLSRLAEELILWSSSEFGFIKLADAYCTGSSIMPQKRNPDVAELIRGKTGRVYGNLMNLLTTLKALPLAYNKDMQEDKMPVIDTAKQLEMALNLMGRMIDTASFNTEKMYQAILEGFLNATDLADYLVGLGIPFRMAHEVAGKSVKWAEQQGITLEEVPLATYQDLLNQCLEGSGNLEGSAISGIQLTESLYQAIDPMESVNRKVSPGSTAIHEVEKMIFNIKQMMKQNQKG